MSLSLRPDYLWVSLFFKAVVQLFQMFSDVLFQIAGILRRRAAPHPVEPVAETRSTVRIFLIEDQAVCDMDQLPCILVGKRRLCASIHKRHYEL